MRIAPCILYAITLIMAPRGQAQPATLEVAARSMADFDYTEAARIYRILLAEDSTHYESLHGLTTADNFAGMDLMSQDKKSLAEAVVERSVVTAEMMARHHPDSASSHTSLAGAYGNLALFKGGKSAVRIGQAVESYCEHAIELDSVNVEAHTILGVFYREVAALNWIQRLVAKTLFGGIADGSLERSINFLDAAAGLDPELPFAAYERAVTLAKMDRNEEARQQYDVFLLLPPQNSQDVRNQDYARQWLAAH